MTDEQRIAASPLATPTRPADDPFAVRRAKLDALRAAGEQPYVDRFDVTARAARARRATTPSSSREPRPTSVVSVAGRLVAKRDQGKIVFLVIRDATGDLQLFCRINALGEEAFERGQGPRPRRLGRRDRHRAAHPPRRAVGRAHARSRCSPSRCARCPRSTTGSPTPRPATASATSTSSRTPRCATSSTTRFQIIAAIRRYMEARGLPRGRDADAARRSPAARPRSRS